MPFKSQSQRRKFYAMSDSGEISKKTVEKWEKETPGNKELPEHVKSAFMHYLDKEAGAWDAMKSVGQKIKGFGRKAGNTLSGANVRQAADKWHPKVMENRRVRKALRSDPTAEPVMSDYVTEVLHGRQKVPLEIFERGSQYRGLVRNLEKGQKAVKGARRSRNLARGAVGAGIALPTAYAIKESALKEDNKVVDVAKTVAPVAAGVGMAASPILQGIKSKALVPKREITKQFKDVHELRRSLRPGDVMMSADPAKGGQWKAMISALGGDPTGYHVETLTGLPGGKKGLDVNAVHATPGRGGAYSYEGSLTPEEDVIVRRFKDKKQARQYLKNIQARAGAEETFESVFGERARGNLYASKQNTRSGIRSLLPEFMGKFIKDPSSPSGVASCSSLTGQCSPTSIAPGVKGKDVLPHHVRRSAALETVGQYTAPRKTSWKAYNALYRAAPWLLRGAAGAGLGYGAYRGVKALTD